MTTKMKITMAQADELKRFAEYIRKNYEAGFYDFDIKCCIRDCTSNYLMRCVFALAFGWFDGKNVPFACVYALCDNFVNNVLAIHGF